MLLSRSADPRTGPRKKSWFALAFLSAVFLPLAYRLYSLTNVYAVNIFHWDQWEIQDATLFQQHSLWEIFRWQHGPHRQGVGGLLAYFVEPLFNWNSRTEAFVALAIVMIAALVALYLKQRLTGSISPADAIIPILFLSPAQWESLFTVVNFAHGTVPLLLILLYCLSMTVTDYRVRLAAMTLLNFAILYTGFGLFLGFLTPLLLAAEWRTSVHAPTRRLLLVCLGVSVASLASFFVGYQPKTSSGCASILSADLWQYFRTFLLLFSTPFGELDGGWVALLVGGLTAILAMGLAARSWIRLWKHPWQASASVTAALTAYSLIFCAATSVGRTCIGPRAWHASRYSNYLELCIFGLYLAAASGRWKIGRVPIAGLLTLLLLPSVTRYDHFSMRVASMHKANWRACYLAGGSIAQCDRIATPIYPEPETTHLREKLDYLSATGQNLFAD